MPYTVTFEGPATGTHLRREWESGETPPSTVDVVFTPENATQELQGTPAASFLDPTPGPGNRLIARLSTPPSSGRRENYTLTITEVGATAKKQVGVELAWG